MNLSQLFSSLSIDQLPANIGFIAMSVPGYPNVRVGMNRAGRPVLLISVIGSTSAIRVPRNYRLQYLTVEHDVACRIIEDSNKRPVTMFSVITFSSDNKTLQEYFLKVSEGLIQVLRGKPSQEEISLCLNNFIEIFSALSTPSKKTIRGLWSELFFISECSDPATIIDYWHNQTEEKFDFNAGNERIEIKSSSTLERIHFFSAEQLNPPIDVQVLIASIFVRSSLVGATISDLAQYLEAKLGKDSRHLAKIHRVIIQTLGSSVEEGIQSAFDHRIAKESLQFYKHQDIYRIEENDIPVGVTNVKYKSDLSNASITTVSTIPNRDVLFNAV